MKHQETAKIILSDGASYSGFSFGAESSKSGEVVFNTGMVGYPESFTDPSYRGQILVLTYPLVGNYGVPPTGWKDNEILKYLESNKIHISGLIVSDYSDRHNHWNSETSLGEWLKKEGIPAIHGIDTRELTKKLREHGVMLGKILCSEEDVQIVDPNERDLVSEVTLNEPRVYNKGADIKIALLDCGCKNNILREFINRGVEVIHLPYDYDLFSLGYEFDGLFISNGPGDPKQCKKTIATVRATLEKKIPVFGICLGNQILALASGADTYKLKYGHRSQNQPCVEAGTKRCYITSQNHGFAVDSKSLKDGWKPWFINANDDTNEGIIHESGLFFSVQFHPESTPGPTDTTFLFDRFIKLLKDRK